MKGQFELVVSPALLGELAGVLDRPKFRRWLTAEEAHEFVSRLRTGATLIDDPPIVASSTPDPGDDYLVALAQKANADCLVSGDGDLTGLAEPQPPVFAPRAPFSKAWTTQDRLQDDKPMRDRCVTRLVGETASCCESHTSPFPLNPSRGDSSR